jgi:hypothetical protein
MRPSTPGAYPKPAGAQTGVKEGGEPPAPPVQPQPSEDVQTCLKSVDELRVVDISTLSESEQHRFAAKLLGHLSKVDSLVDSKLLQAERASELQDWLTHRLRAVHESLANAADSAIDRIIETVTATGDDTDTKQAIEALQQKVTEAVDKAEQFRAELEQMQSTQQEAEMREEVLEAERDEAQARLEAVQEELTAERAKLSLATETIRSLTATDVTDEKQAAVEEAIQQHPELEKFRGQLENAATPEVVESVVESVLEDLVKSGSVLPKPPVEQTHRLGLPSKGMVVESDARVGSRRPSSAESLGARLAGKAVAKMSVRP